MSEELQVVPIEEQISQELVKHNVTQAVISGLKEAYGHLKINGIEDKETYLLVKEGRKECKAFRVAAKKICEKGREEAVAIQKAWVAKQKEVTDQIAAIEDPLEEQERAYEAAVAKEKEDRKRKQEEQLIMRQQVLTNMGALYSDGSFHLGEVSFELSVVKESEADIWEESILPKFKEEYEKVEAERIEQERIKQEREAEMKRQQDELDKKQKELEQKEAELKKAEEEKLKREIDELARKEAEAEEQIRLTIAARCGELQSIGMSSEFPSMDYVYKDVRVTLDWVKSADKIEWDETIGNIKPDIEQKKAEAEQKRLAEIEAQKEAERKKMLGSSRAQFLAKFGADPKSDFTEGGLALLTGEEWGIVCADWEARYEKAQKEKWEREQEENRKQEELNKQLELEKAKDKEKWEDIIRRVNEIEVYEMRSSQYRKKAMILREKLEEIKAL